MTQSLIASLVLPLIGRTVISTDKTGAETRFTIARLADKIGTLKDGSKGEYVVLTKDGETGVVINMHPNTAKKLAKTANADNFSLLIDLKTTPIAEPVAGTELDAADQAAVQAELDAANGVTPSEKLATYLADADKDEAGEAHTKEHGHLDVKPAAEVPAEAKAPSKKSRTVAMFKEMTAEGKPRKDIIAKMKSELGLSAPGANTYYQNCKSGAWE